MKYLIVLLAGLLLTFKSTSDICHLEAQPVYARSVTYHLPEIQRDYASQIVNYAESAQVDPCLIYGIAMRETRGNHYRHGKVIRGGSGEYGMFQVMPYHFKKHENPADFTTNLNTAIRYFKDCGRRFSNMKQQISCYNTGGSRYNSKYVDYVIDQASLCERHTITTKMKIYDLTYVIQ